MTTLDFVAAALAVMAITDCWLNGDIFATRKARVQSAQDHCDPEGWKSWFCELALCDFCQSYWLGWILALFLITGTLWVATQPYDPPIALAVVRIFVYGLAIQRLSWIINGLLPERMRYHREKKL